MFDSINEWLPAVNAALIVISGVCLTFGYVFIRNHKVAWHRRSMVTASFFAAAFLVVYVTRWALLGSKGFAGEGPGRVMFFVILISHTVIAILVAPFAFVTLRRALAGRFQKHRQIARITLPMWIYTAITGWIVYMLIYSPAFN